MKNLSLKNRKCECCGGKNFKLVFSHRTDLKTHHHIYLFRSFVVICKNCGFCFNSPCQTESDLMDYYADCYSINQKIPAAYSIEKRLDVLKKYAGGNYVEIGGNQSSEFHKRLKNISAQLKMSNRITRARPI